MGNLVYREMVPVGSGYLGLIQIKFFLGVDLFKGVSKGSRIKEGGGGKGRTTFCEALEKRGIRP